MIDDDKLIAEFIEIKVREWKPREHTSLVILDEDGCLDFDEIEFYNPRHDWNQLMLAVIKMEKLGYAMHIDPWSVEIVEYRSGKENTILSYDRDYEDNPIMHYYYPLVEFIKWYNKNLTDETK